MDEQNKDNKESDRKFKLGCSIVIILYIIGQLIYLFATSSRKDIAEIGSMVFIGVVIVAAFILAPKISNAWDKYKAKNESEGKYTKNKIGCIIAVIAAIALIIIVGVLSYNFDFTYELGVIGIVAVAAIIGWLIYSNLNE
ncbi:MAG: hypothetical protein J5621_06230 [Paludibacteraceae bacterium]|nr:hypothetical protein [Paludibacteraceae bacterium]